MNTEALALVLRALAGGRGFSLLEGLSEVHRGDAQTAFTRLSRLPALHRRARLAQAFGERPDARRALRLLMAELSPRLQAEVYRLMPSHLQPFFPAPVAEWLDGSISPAQQRLARRLLREALT